VKFEVHDPRQRYTDQELLDDVHRVATEIGNAPLSTRDYEARGRYKASTLTSRFGSWVEVIRRAGISITHTTRPTSDGCLEDLRKLAHQLGTDTLTIGDYRENGGRFSVTPFMRHFGSWRNALRQAGLRVRPPRFIRITDVDLFENFEKVWITLGRQPRLRDFRKSLSPFSWGPYVRRFGSWRDALEAFGKYIEEEEKQPDQRESQHPNESDGPEPESNGALNPDDTILPPPLESSHTLGEAKASSSVALGDRSVRQTREPRRTPRHPSLRLTFIVMRRDRFCCKYCGQSPAKSPGVTLHVDHIVAWSQGGETHLENLQTLCEACNLGKSNLSEEIRS